MNSGWPRAWRRWFVALAVVLSTQVALVPHALAQEATPVSSPTPTEGPAEPGAVASETALPTETPVATQTPVLTDTRAVALPAEGELRSEGTPPSEESGNQPMRLSVQSASTDTEGLTCVQVSAGDDVLAAGEYVVFQCDNGDSSLLKTGNDPNYYLTVQNLTPGWRYSYVASATSPSGDPASNPGGWGVPKTTAGDTVWGGNNITKAYIALGPIPDIALPGDGELQLEFLQGRNYAAPGKSYVPPRLATLGATYREQAVPCQPVASASSVAFAVSTRTPEGYPVSSANVLISVDLVDDGVCSGFPDAWSVQMSAAAMTGPDGATIPPEAISYSGAAPGGAPPQGVTAVSGVLPLSTEAQAIAVGDTNAEAGAWEVVLSVSPSPNAPPGDYTGTLTIDIGSSSG